MQIPSHHIETVCFLGVEDSLGSIVARASAFYVVVPFRHDRKMGRGYLVTARHNVEKAAGRNLYVSINTGFFGGQRAAKWQPVSVEKWFTHPSDNSVDIAIADWRPPLENQRSYFGTLTDAFIEGMPESGPHFELIVGMGTATIGLFAHHAGQAIHTPIARIGNLAALPADRVKTALGYAEAYLIEARSVGGLSGSPVFVREETYFGSCRFPLIGLIQGHFDWKMEAEENDWQPINTGIAVVTPSIKIIDILIQEDCRKTRDGFNCIF
jgi:hypothetical protein